jgi:hypothetical protein
MVQVQSRIRADEMTFDPKKDWNSCGLGCFPEATQKNNPAGGTPVPPGRT